LTATLLFIHGRSQASPPEMVGDDAALATYVAAKRRNWLAGLGRGLTHAGLPPVNDAVFPFYGNDFRQRIEDHERRGGRRPELELGDPDEGTHQKLLETKSAALDDALRAYGFDASRQLGYLDPEMGAEAADVEALELGWNDLLRVRVLRSGLQFLARKTGTPATIIEEFLTDVAYYLELPQMRESVLQIVERALRAALPNGGDIVVVGHSLGSIVAYDLLTRLPAEYRVRLLVTAGSPLGFPVVQKNLLGHVAGQPVAIPGPVPGIRAGWLNAYDEHDFVALIHPLAGTFTSSVTGQLRDERTLNQAANPHSIADYLSDPDVAAPIGRAVQ